MPYTICVNKPGCLPEQNPTAVATIDEAREAAWNEISIPDDVTQSALDGWMEQVQSIGEAGGTVGPMPDGYVIDVQHVSMNDLRVGTGTLGMSVDELVEHYNVTVRL